MAHSCELSLKWLDNSDNEDGFRIERATLEGEYELIGQTERNLTKFTDTIEDHLTVYRYRVCAFNAFGQSGYTNVYIYQPYLDPDKPTGPDSCGGPPDKDIEPTSNQPDDTSRIPPERPSPTDPGGPAPFTIKIDFRANSLRHTISRNLPLSMESAARNVLLVSHDMVHWERATFHKRLTEKAELFTLTAPDSSKTCFYRFVSSEEIANLIY